MKVDVLLGLQWGDEGKGKVVDVITPNYKAIARFQGGPNAGHTLEIGDKKFILHTIPSGIFHENVDNIVGNGVVIDPVILRKELQKLSEMGDSFEKKLKISYKAHVILPSHRLLDAAQEFAKGKSKIGSTLKGIGPTYTDKISRNGLRTGDVFESDFIDKYKALKERHLRQIRACDFDYSEYQIDGLLFDDYEKQWFQAVEHLKKLQFVHSEYDVNDLLLAGEKVLAEGAQGSLLDVDFGSYPFVTSSNTICAGVGTGLGVAPNKIGEVFGIFKAYCTRVGSGPFPTELHNTDGEKLRKAGHEFGSTTGRPRRCGWLDLVALKYTVMLNGVTKLIMTKGDVLDSMDSIKICTHYNFNGQIIDRVPFNLETRELEPVYKEFKGWKQNTTAIKEEKEFPSELKAYIEFIEKELNVPVTIVSVGPNRDQTIVRASHHKK